MGDGVANGELLDLSRLRALHFARLVLVEESRDLEGERLPACLIYLSDFDVSKDEHLADFVDEAGDAIDRLFGHCVGYPAVPPTAEQRRAFLRANVVKEQARYVNTIGRTATQICQEAELRDRIETHLDARADELRGRDPAAIRQDVRRLVES